MLKYEDHYQLTNKLKSNFSPTIIKQDIKQ